MPAPTGRAPLPLNGVIAVVLDERDRVLPTRSSDTGDWALTTGCLEPGEQPADGARREVFEETGVTVEVERLLSAEALDLSVAPDGVRSIGLRSGFAAELSLVTPGSTTTSPSKSAGSIRTRCRLCPLSKRAA